MIAKYSLASFHNSASRWRRQSFRVDLWNSKAAQAINRTCIRPALPKCRTPKGTVNSSGKPTKVHFRFHKDIRTAISEASLSTLQKKDFNALIGEFAALNKRNNEIGRKLVAICRTEDLCKRLTTLPIVGPVIATAWIAAIDDGRHFASGRAFAAWIGLVPRQYTTRGKPRLGGIDKRAINTCAASLSTARGRS